MGTIKWLAAAAALNLLAACGGGGSSSGGDAGANRPVTSTVSGTVVDAGGAPVAGATISAFHHNNHTTVTAVSDANGRYALAGLETGNFTDYAVYATKPGLAFAMAIADASGSVQRFDFDGQYRGVIRFETVPARDVAGANFVAYRAGDRRVALPRTGQATSYASGDDADRASGVAWPGSRFVDNGDGTVTDRLTGLLWLKDAGCKAVADWTTALAAARGLASGQCGLSDGSIAGQWRMPNANELESLVDASQARPAVSAGHPFANIDLMHAYWTSTTYTARTTNAMAIRFSDGRWINGIDAGDTGFDNDKLRATNGLWAVRSGAPGAVKVMATGTYAGIGGGSFGAGDDASLQLGVALNSPRFVDKGDGTVADTMTGLVWLKKADCISASWALALARVGQLADGQCGLADGSTPGQWRMPNRAEMLSLSDRAPTFPQASYLGGQYRGDGVVVGPVIFGNYVVGDYYWTSTTDAADTSQAWTVYSCDFGVYNIAKTDLRFALAVR